MRAGDKEPGAFSLPIHRARHRSLKLAASHAAIFGIFYVHWNRAHHLASAIVEPSGAIKWWSRFDFLQAFSRRNFMTITTGHIPCGANRWHSHFDHAAAAESGRRDLPDLHRPDRTRAAQMASPLASKSELGACAEPAKVV